MTSYVFYSVVNNLVQEVLSYVRSYSLAQFAAFILGLLSNDYFMAEYLYAGHAANKAGEPSILLPLQRRGVPVLTS
jgi:hypothetical protein